MWKSIQENNFGGEPAAKISCSGAPQNTLSQINPEHQLLFPFTTKPKPNQIPRISLLLYSQAISPISPTFFETAASISQ